MSNMIPRRAFLGQAGVAGTAIATGLAASTPTSAQAQTVAADPAGRPADVVLKNAKIITVDRDFSIVQAVAIAGERILAAGSDASMAAHTARATRVLDLKGRTVTPGMIDGHAHMDREGLKGIYPALGPVRSIRDILNRIAELASAKPRGEWIVTMPIGDPPYYFDVPDILAEKRWPTRQELDAAAPENPVFIRSCHDHKVAKWEAECKRAHPDDPIKADACLTKTKETYDRDVNPILRWMLGR